MTTEHDRFAPDDRKPRTREELEAMLKPPEFRSKMMDGSPKSSVASMSAILLMKSSGDCGDCVSTSEHISRLLPSPYILTILLVPSPDRYSPTLYSPSC